jgi:hypothetical protein
MVVLERHTAKGTIPTAKGGTITILGGTSDAKPLTTGRTSDSSLQWPAKMQKSKLYAASA